ncbi:SusD/RagB family nutrient-binding outer membrane lipoprotein [Terrimonas rubra]|uniref:SusD/RagB family nutrient-binding outer membrane lipoprotein n=1 Tax=Terrimonas rubra TaxID=1035890 RepID=A0ABW6A7M3_9BACT
MKKLKYIIVASIAIATMGSCKKFLDINKNPNSATESTPELVLPQALTSTGNAMVGYNSYGGWQVGYMANAGGFGGFGSALTYNYGQNDYNGLWNLYDNLQDYQYIIEKTGDDPLYANYNAIARIMKAMGFQMLVDQYNNIPYTNALKGSANVAPSYDNAEDIYRDLYSQLDQAITIINNAASQFPLNPGTTSFGSADPIFKGNMTSWKQLANTLKLKLLIRASAKSTFSGVTPSFDAAGFITADVISNPGYGKVDGQQNPMWSTYHSSVAGASAQSGRSNITTNYVVTFYNGVKLLDANRAKAIYRGGTSPIRNQLGITDDNVPEAPANGPVWFSGNGSTFAFGDDPDGTTSAKSAVGVLKGRNMGMVIMLAAESYFLQAEARVKGILTSGATAKDLFEDGIEASFTYLYKNSTGNIAANPLNLTNPVADAASYLTDNGTSKLVNFDLATTNAEKLEAIITQKYIALNFIHGHEAWNEFRRTGYPTISGTAANTTFVSVLSAATTPDKLLGRVQYPASEYQINSKNVPSGITVFGSYVFWDRRN